MKIQVLKDRKGQIVASFEPAQGSSPTLQPQPAKGHQLESLDVPDDYARKLGVLYKPRKSAKTSKRK